MPTDSFSIAWAGPLARTNKSVSGQYMDASNLVDSIADTLKAGGWIEVEKTYPRAGIFLLPGFMPVRGEPIPPEQRQPAECRPQFRNGPGLECGPYTGHIISSYDPNRQLPPPCDNFEHGYDPEQTRENMASAISGTTPLNATVSLGGSGFKPLELTARDAGTLWNGYCTWVSPYYGVAGQLWGGGYKLRSQTYNGTFIELVVTAADTGSVDLSVRLDWAVNSSIAVRDSAYPTARAWPVAPGQAISWLYTWQTRTYTIWACPYQMAIWARDIDGDSIGSQGVTACLASIPRVPVDHPGYGQAVILPNYYAPLGRGTGGNQRTSLTWTPVLLSVGSALQYVINNDAGIAGLRLPEYPLLNAEGKPLLHNPYVWTRYGTKAGVIGQLWNSVVVSSDEFARDSVMQWDGQKYLCMSKQRGYGKTAGGLWLAVN